METRFHELLSRVAFDDLMPTLKKLCESKPFPKTGLLPQFKRAFDELGQIEPIDSDEIIFVDRCESFICADVSDEPWNKVLGKRIRLEEGLILSDGELCAHILWDLTYFGFGEEDIQGHIHRMNNPNIYQQKIDLLRQKRDEMYIRNENLYEDGHILLSGFMTMMQRRKRRNRAKRMRDARIDRAIQKLKKLSVREDAILKFVNTGLVPRHSVEYIINTEYGELNRYKSRAKSCTDRVEYILELIEKYSELDFSIHDSICTVATCSPEHPFTEEEKDRLQDYFNSKQGFNRLQIVFGDDSSITSHHMTLLMILTKDK